MKNLVKIQFIVIAVLVVLLWLKGCSSSNGTIEVTTPEEKGKFEAVKPAQKPIELKKEVGPKLSNSNQSEIERLKREYNLSQEEVEKMIAENKKYAEYFENKTDSLSTELKNLTQLYEFTQKFEDENLVALIHGIGRGDIERLGIATYTIKEKKIDVPTKSKTFQLNAGGGIGIDKEATNVIYKLGVDLINSKGNQIELEYQKINGVDYGMVGYKFKVFAF